jgi:hypothetical protein
MFSVWPNGTQLGDLKGDETVLVLLCHEFKDGTEHGLESVIARAAADVPMLRSTQRIFVSRPT